MGKSIFFAILSFFIVETTFNNIDVTIAKIVDKPMVFLYCLIFLSLFFGGLEKLKNKRAAAVLISGITSFISLANYVTMRFNNKFFAFSDIAYFGDKLEVLSMFVSKIYSPLLLVVLGASTLYVTLSLMYKEELSYDYLEQLPQINDKFYYVCYEKLEPIVFYDEEQGFVERPCSSFLSNEQKSALRKQKKIARATSYNEVNRRIDFMEEIEHFTDEAENFVQCMDSAIEKLAGKKNSPLFSSNKWGVVILAMMIVLSQFVFSFDRFYFSNLMYTYKALAFETKDVEVYKSFGVPAESYGKTREDIVYSELEKDVDIVIIQSEAFFDFAKIKNLNFSKSITKNFRKYQKEGMWGKSFVPVVGGMTCNSEFEFLKSIRIKDMYGYQMPFEEAPLMETDSLARDFKNYGYDTKAVHGYRRDFFQRDKVYPMLGIDEFIAEDDFEEAKYYGAWMSDESIFDRILEELAEGEKSKTNQFIYSVTVQNHGPFSYKAPKDVVEVDNLPKEDRASLENYAAGLKISDEALGEFMQEIEKRKKETIVVFYGDHIFSSEHQIITKNPYFAENLNNKYATDYFMWSNKGSIESEQKDQTLMALSRELKKQVMPITYFDKFILENYATEEAYFEGIDPFKHEAYKTVVNRVYTNSGQKFDPVYLPINEYLDD